MISERWQMRSVNTELLGLSSPQFLNIHFQNEVLPTVTGTGETPGPIPNPEVKPCPVPRCTAFREGAGSAETVGIFH